MNTRHSVVDRQPEPTGERRVGGVDRLAKFGLGVLRAGAAPFLAFSEWRTGEHGYQSFGDALHDELRFAARAIRAGLNGVENPYHVPQHLEPRTPQHDRSPADLPPPEVHRLP